jgi:hypothetical protein
MTGREDRRRRKAAEVGRRDGYTRPEATTNMNNETNTTATIKTKTAAKKAPKVRYNYPFETKAQILASQADFSTCLEHLGQLYDAQTSEEQDAKDTRVKNARGFMSSHAVTGSTLAVKARSGEELTPEEQDKVRQIVKRYGKQLAAFSRKAAMEANPALKAIAEIFSAA